MGRHRIVEFIRNCGLRDHDSLAMCQVSCEVSASKRATSKTAEPGIPSSRCQVEGLICGASLTKTKQILDLDFWQICRLAIGKSGSYAAYAGYASEFIQIQL